MVRRPSTAPHRPTPPYAAPAEEHRRHEPAERLAPSAGRVTEMARTRELGRKEGGR